MDEEQWSRVEVTHEDAALAQLLRLRGPEPSVGGVEYYAGDGGPEGF